jgi:hypothetical protein
MPRFEVIQPNGKHRPIDDGKRYGHNDAAAYTETLDCCTATQPVAHLRAVVRQAAQLGIPQSELATTGVETGGEDLPDAYRWVPNAEEDHSVNVVGMWDSRVQMWVYQVVYGQVFGKAAAVVSFHRPQRFVQSMLRRWVLILVTMYFDDATVQDFAEAKGRGQRYIRALMRMVGLPFAEEKQVNMTHKADFLGLVHEVANCFATGKVPLYPRERLTEKLVEMADSILDNKSCTPAEASKLRGTSGFYMTGQFGKVGRGGQHALVQRQYADSPPWDTSFFLERSVVYLRQVAQLRLYREIKLFGPARPPLVVASDGRLDDSRPPSIAVLIVDPESGRRVAWVAYIPPQLVDRWENISDRYIALVEQAALIMGLQMASEMFRGRDFVWYEDNSVVLSGLVKGANHGAELDAGCATIHLGFAKIGARGWYEYVESAANWADGASRVLHEDPFLREHGFETYTGQVPLWPWCEPASSRVARVEEWLKY